MKKELKFFAVLLTTATLLFAGCTGAGNTPSVPDTSTTPVVPIKPEQPASLTNISSVDFAKSMIIGWNLGNAFDASGTGDWAYNEGLKMEYNWLPYKQPTSQKLIKTIAATGFNTIRIPVSWHNHMDKETYKIDSAWMKRVKEVVDWAIAEDMFVIINIHHDNLTEDEMKNNPGFCVSETEALQTTSKAYIKTVWEQIADAFKDYDNHLVFELLNEPRCVGTDWAFNETIGRQYNSIITAYEQVALDVIRSSGGNNPTRFVMTPAYAAAPTTPAAYTLPTDTAEDKLLLSVHAYTPSDFALDGDKSDYDANKSYIETQITSVFNNLSTNYVKNGIGVVMGEASASDKKNTESRIKWAKYYFTKAKAAGIPVVLWDNEQSTTDTAEKAGDENHGYFNRATCKQYYPAIVNAMMKATYDNFEETTTPDEDSGDTDDTGSDSVLFEGNYILDWKGEKKVFEASNFSNATATSKFVFTTIPLETAPEYVNVKLQAGDWSQDNVFYKGVVTGGSISNDVIELSTSTTSFTYTPTADEWEIIKSKGIVVYGYGIKITKINLQ